MCCIGRNKRICPEHNRMDKTRKPINFILANDLGRNGYYDQKPIAELMGKMAENVDIEFVVAARCSPSFSVRCIAATMILLWMEHIADL